ncbi:hypothetical protein K3495_g1023 [Podosphaera aphanis]|nr:hypothetical protein K3495_g1023 [Podosphaera aphanis]
MSEATTSTIDVNASSTSVRYKKARRSKHQMAIDAVLKPDVNSKKKVHLSTADFLRILTYLESADNFIELYGERSNSANGKLISRQKAFDKFAGWINEERSLRNERRAELTGKSLQARLLTYRNKHLQARQLTPEDKLTEEDSREGISISEKQEAICPFFTRMEAIFGNKIDNPSKYNFGTCVDTPTTVRSQGQLCSPSEVRDRLDNIERSPESDDSSEDSNVINDRENRHATSRDYSASEPAPRNTTAVQPNDTNELLTSFDLPSPVETLSITGVEGAQGSPVRSSRPLPVQRTISSTNCTSTDILIKKNEMEDNKMFWEKEKFVLELQERKDKLLLEARERKDRLSKEMLAKKEEREFQRSEREAKDARAQALVEEKRQTFSDLLSDGRSVDEALKIMDTFYS